MDSQDRRGNSLAERRRPFQACRYETVAHPSGKSNVSAERAIYTVERASEYTALAVEVLTTCLSVPRTDRRRISERVTGSSHVAPWLHDAYRERRERG